MGTQDRGQGINNILAWIDQKPAASDNTVFGNFGLVPCVGCTQGVVILVSGKGVLNTAGKPQASIIAHQYGSQFDFAGWSISMNPALLSPGPHTLFVTATSSVTGKQSMASVDFNIIAFHAGQRVQP